MPRMKLTVTSKDIKESIRNDSNNCMIACAIKAKLPNVRWVLVDLQTIRYTDRFLKQKYIFLTPKPAQKALLDFDKGLTVKPFHFTLPEPIVKPVYTRKPRAKVVEKTKTKKVYKKVKVVPEKVAVRRYGLRMFE